MAAVHRAPGNQSTSEHAMNIDTRWLYLRRCRRRGGRRGGRNEVAPPPAPDARDLEHATDLKSWENEGGNLAPSRWPGTAVTACLRPITRRLLRSPRLRAADGARFPDPSLTRKPHHEANPETLMIGILAATAAPPSPTASRSTRTTTTAAATSPPIDRDELRPQRLQ